MDRKRLLTDFYHFFPLRIKLTDPAAEPYFAKKLACGYLSTVMVHATKHHVPGLPIRTHHEVEARLSTGKAKAPPKWRTQEWHLFDAARAPNQPAQFHVQG